MRFLNGILLLCSIALLILSPVTEAQFPKRPKDVQIINSTVFDGVQIKYKEVDICTSLSSTARSFAGYISLPPNTLRVVGLDQKFPINTFFWFFESQHVPERAPLTLYLNGGPGAPSTKSLLRENGPCRVELNGRSTRANPWSWNQISNMLYIDQPVNTGFSYDAVANATIDFRGNQTVGPAILEYDSRLRNAGTIGMGATNTHNAFNTTEAAVRAIWLFLSTWLQDFPEHKSSNSQVELWAASYGGHYAPALYDFTMLKNAEDAPGPKIRFSTLGLMNACIDASVELPKYPEMAYRNTHGLQLINESTYLAAKGSWDGPHGCKSRILACREATGHSPYLGTNTSINIVCHNANVFCGKHMSNLISASGRSYYDIGHGAHYLTDPELYTYLAYLKLQHVQTALGVPVNFTDQASQIAKAFSRTGDNLQGNYLAALGRALDDGVHVSLIYGDRDYACNWLGGEALSHAIMHKQSQEFKDAGYQEVRFPLKATDSDKGTASITPGAAYVRQHGNLSFTRVLDSGHTVNIDRPVVGFTLFNRTLAGVDIASGLIPLRENMEELPQQGIYSTQGQSSIWDIKNKLPIDAYEAQAMCYALALSLCSNEQLNAYLTGRATVRDYWVLDYGNGTCIPNPIEPCNGAPGVTQERLRNIWSFSHEVKNGSWIQTQFLIAVSMLLVIVSAVCALFSSRLIEGVAKPTASSSMN